MKQPSTKPKNKIPTFASAMTDADRQLVVKTIINGPAFVFGGKRFAEIDPNCLSIDYNYQRQPEMNRVKRIADSWDVRKAGIITCSYRNGALYVVEGQHRTLAARMANVPAIAIEILTGLTPQEEALLFANQDDDKRKVSNIAKYNANLFAGTGYAVQLNDMLASYGLTLALGKTASRADGIITCTSILQSLVLNPVYGFDCLQWILQTFKQATWLTAPNAIITKHIANMMFVWREGVTDGTLVDYTNNLTEFLSAVTPAGFQTLAAHAFPNLADHRANNRAMFYAVARGEIHLTDPIIREACGTD